MKTLVWLRDDLRVADNPALFYAAQDSDVTAIFLLDEESEHVRPLGAASKWWLHHSLRSLQESLQSLGVQLVLRRGKAEEIIPSIVQELEADRVYWNRRYGPARQHDANLKQTLKSAGVEARSFQGDLLFEPWHVTTKSGTPYRVYAAFWRACNALGSPPNSVSVPTSVSVSGQKIASEDLNSWRLLPKTPDWATGLAERWIPGEKSARETLKRFLAHRAGNYFRRDFPAETSGSELSAHLRWGEISPREVWHQSIASGVEVGLFLSELGWREFATHTNYHFGPMHVHGLNPKFNEFEWRELDENAFTAWSQGETGFELVDAGMRELWQTGFMHNRVRMVTASFFTKNLRFDWRHGEAWFWDTLVDADEASNSFNWQWVAGSGADAAPYFRIFNPELQQQKFDPNREYISRWAPDSVMLPKIVDLKHSRAEALEAYQNLTRGSANEHHN